MIFPIIYAKKAKKIVFVNIFVWNPSINPLISNIADMVHFFEEKKCNKYLIITICFTFLCSVST